MNARVSSGRSDDGEATKIARINARQVIIATIITAVAGIAGALIQGMAASGKIASLNSQLNTSASKVEQLQSSLEGPAASIAEREALYRLTADYIESDLTATAGKGRALRPGELTETELNYRLLRRAVFLNIGIIRANPKLLENTLQVLAKRGRTWIDGQTPRILADFPQIKAVRLRWLEDLAIPQLQKAIDEVAANPRIQSVPKATVPLPRDVWILNHEAGDEPTATVTSMAVLKDEVDLLKRSL